MDLTFKVTSSSANGGINSAASTAASLAPNRYKTELCRPFQEYGYCKYGDKCQFAHGLHDLRSLPRHPKYKTELCRTFYSNGYCPYGTRCHFIHSKNEIQPITGSFPRPIMQVPPTSPSQDSGISSPDDTVSFLLGGGNGKTFDFPLALSDTSNEDSNDAMFPPYSDYLQQGGGYLSSPIDPLINDTESISSNSSNSPVKPFKMTYLNESFDNATNHVEDFVPKVSSSISLDDSIFTSSSHTRLPVFDMLNSHSAASIEMSN